MEEGVAGEEKEVYYPRRNGWNCPWHPLQVLAWTFIVFFTTTYFGFLVFYIPGAWRSIGYIVSTQNYSYCLYVHAITYLLTSHMLKYTGPLYTQKLVVHSIYMYIPVEYLIQVTVQVLFQIPPPYGTVQVKSKTTSFPGPFLPEVSLYDCMFLDWLYNTKVAGALFVTHILASLVTSTLDPAELSVRRKRPGKMGGFMRAVFDRKKHSRVIENHHCNLCEVQV